jgi:valyl-tRNA synthetase
MIADVAVAVHPSDPRYAGIVGKMLELPLFGRQIPIISDPYVEMDFGTGALKITPAHDANDYQVGIRHGLPMPLAFDEDCRVKEEGPYLGMDRKEARTAIVKDLEAAGFLVGTEDREIPLIISDRSKEIIEPLLSEQWFVDQPTLAKPVIAAVTAGEVSFHPARYEGIFLAWMENIREWCISRQLWWGHRIPIYYTESGKPIAALSWEDALAKADGETIVRQDDDVLDTWFSSGLWPFATLGWPEETEDLKRFYPTDVLVTDRNIINLWVARMMMMGYDLTGQRPFRDVVIYATVLNENGQRMSKSLGTGVDPMGVINTLGADVLRWTLLSQTGENQDLRYSEKKNEEGRNFANKIWNATRFVLMNVTTMPPVPTELEKVDEWLLSRLNATIQEVTEAYDSFDLQRACQALVRFFWYEVCDWYIEVAKPRLQNESLQAVPQWCLLTVFDAFLKLLHPVMPFLTEELYGYLPLPNKSEYLMAAPWPVMGTNYAESEAAVGRAFEVTRALRSLRAGLDLAAMKPIPRAYFVGDLAGVEEIVRTQAWTEELVGGVPAEKSVSTTIAGVDLYIPVDGLIDVDKQRSRLAKEEENLAAELKKLTDRLSNPQFTERAKPEVIERDRAAVADLEDRLEKNRERQRLFA